MARTKWSLVKSRLKMVEGWSKNGLTESQICKNLGVNRTTLNDFKDRYPELLEAINRGREMAVAEIENALFKRALGYDFEETKESSRVIDGKTIKCNEKIKNHLPPDVAACFILLKNKDHSNWCDNPAKRDLAREIFEFDKLIEKIRLIGDDSLDFHSAQSEHVK